MSLTKEEIKEWFEVNDLIEVSDVFGVRDMLIRGKLEKKMSPKQKQILEDAITSIEDYGVKPSKAYRVAYDKLRKVV